MPKNDKVVESTQETAATETKVATAAELLKMDYAQREAAIRERMTAEGFTEERQDRGVSLPFLPSAGKFVDFQYNRMMRDNAPVLDDNGNEIGWYDMLTEPVGHISLNALVFQCAETPDKANVVHNADKGIYTLSTTATNPQCSGKAPQVIAMLLGRSFEATEKTGYVQKYVAGGATSMDDVIILPKRGYKVDIKK